VGLNRIYKYSYKARSRSCIAIIIYILNRYRCYLSPYNIIKSSKQMAPHLLTGQAGAWGDVP
jgi:hypothetical protein